MLRELSLSEMKKVSGGWGEEEPPDEEQDPDYEIIVTATRTVYDDPITSSLSHGGLGYFGQLSGGGGTYTPSVTPTAESEECTSARARLELAQARLDWSLNNVGPMRTLDGGTSALGYLQLSASLAFTAATNDVNEHCN